MFFKKIKIKTLLFSLLLISSMPAFADNDVFNFYGVELKDSPEKIEKTLEGQGFKRWKNVFSADKENIKNLRVFINISDDKGYATNVTIEIVPKNPSEAKAANAIYLSFLKKLKDTYGEPNATDFFDRPMWEIKEENDKIVYQILQEKNTEGEDYVAIVMFLKTW